MRIVGMDIHRSFAQPRPLENLAHIGVAGRQPTTDAVYLRRRRSGLQTCLQA